MAETDPQDIRIVSVSPPAANNPLANDVTFHLEPAPPRRLGQGVPKSMERRGDAFPAT